MENCTKAKITCNKFKKKKNCCCSFCTTTLKWIQQNKEGFKEHLIVQGIREDKIELTVKES